MTQQRTPPSAEADPVVLAAHRETLAEARESAAQLETLLLGWYNAALRDPEQAEAEWEA